MTDEKSNGKFLNSKLFIDSKYEPARNGKIQSYDDDL